MKNLILNEGYNKKSTLFEKGYGDKIYFKGKKTPKSADLKDGAAEGKHLKSQGARKINPCQNKPKILLAIKRIVMCA